MYGAGLGASLAGTGLGLAGTSAGAGVVGAGGVATDGAAGAAGFGGAGVSSMIGDCGCVPSGTEIPGAVAGARLVVGSVGAPGRSKLITLGMFEPSITGSAALLSRSRR